MARARLKRSEARRRHIIQAALACFADHGYEQTTLAMIRERSGASTGSIYHHFQSKEQLAAAVYLEGIVDWQKGFTDQLERARGAKAGITAIVRFHLEWVRTHPDWARYLFQMRHSAFMEMGEEEMKRANDRFFALVGSWFRKHIQSGRLKKLPKELYVAILMGPSQDFAKQWLSGRTSLDLERATKVLGEAAWSALKAKAE